MQDEGTSGLGDNTIGIVYIVGAGPGDPELITVKGQSCLESADVVVYDRLINPRLLELAPKEAELIYAGKTPNDNLDSQTKINSLLIQHAKKSNVVVRLKGGDPYLFGRGGEEAETLREAKIPFEIVPGVTSALAAPAYAGIPLTYRNLSSSITIVTGTESQDKKATKISWAKLAKFGGTIVVLMGWENLDRISSDLIMGGCNVDTPAALIHRGTEPNQQTVVGTLSNISEKGRAAGLSPPVVLIIGNVVRLRNNLRWFDNQPLFAKKVLVTRAVGQARTLSNLLTRAGAIPIEIPTIKIRPPSDTSRLAEAITKLSSYDWVVFTSSNAVNAVFDYLSTLGRDARSFHTIQIAGIGSATAANLRSYGIEPDYVPKEYVSGDVILGLDKLGVKGKRILLPRSNISHVDLIKKLESLGASVDEVTAYDTSIPKGAKTRVNEVLCGKLDVAIFTSSSTVENLMSLADNNPRSFIGTKIACIGPITATTAEAAGLKVDVIPSEHTVAGLVKALKRYFKERVISDE